MRRSRTSQCPGRPGLWLALALSAALPACQTPPEPAPVEAPSARDKVLREFGFEHGDDGWELQLSGKLLFDFNSDVLDDPRSTTVAEMGRALLSVGITRLRIEGHTDDVGSDAYNQRLSLRRAQAVARVMQEVGFAEAQLAVHGYGRSKPIASSGRSERARRENRRVAIIVPTP